MAEPLSQTSAGLPADGAPQDEDHRWMALALDEARAAAAAGEVPVGAVLVRDGRMVATGRNAPVATHDPSAHAEMAALRAAGQALGNYRLDGCTLYVTLEPCAMCAGAMLHARLDRVVFGAADERTGAAGSVLDLFGIDQLNHQTAVQGGVMAEACGALLQDFFRGRRAQARAQAQPVRDDALRTPEARFAGFDGPPAYMSELPALHRLRLAYVDRGGDDATHDRRPAVLCLHGAAQWGHLFRHLPALLPDHRLLIPDLIGFGRSDKPKKEGVHTPEWHAQVLGEWLAALGVGEVGLIVHPDMADLAGLLAEQGTIAGPPLVIAPSALAVRGAAAEDAARAWAAPFPDKGHEAALRAWGARRRPVQDLSADAARALADQWRARRGPMGYSRG
ncbi:tRNA adenosine(34) deaminase TadA [uncultured Pseudacidovorax sp.]|uniref:tRNA adenosine(34) deaminase TadA n=1 Tax=uncultured Pseudacidovorax sp. TaxID=679313 RepID=UPI0025D0BB18|nr:tRNA adenosine(34) deaminase TadA [uncultured Pseudacidovorax sp.]